MHHQRILTDDHVTAIRTKAQPLCFGLEVSTCLALSFIWGYLVGKASLCWGYFYRVNNLIPHIYPQTRVDFNR